jgi:hypothetical protein
MSLLPIVARVSGIALLENDGSGYIYSRARNIFKNLFSSLTDSISISRIHGVQDAPHTPCTHTLLPRSAARRGACTCFVHMCPFGTLANDSCPSCSSFVPTIPTFITGTTTVVVTHVITAAMEYKSPISLRVGRKSDATRRSFARSLQEN